MRLAILGMVGAGLLGSATAHAADSSLTGLEVGLRTGYAVPFGDVYGAANGASSLSLGDQTNGVLPIWIDAGYRFSPNIFLGAFFQYGFAFINTSKAFFNGCSGNGVSCSGSDVMVGVDLHYHLLPEQTIDPWGGIGVGYEIGSLSQSPQGGASSGASYNGFQFFNLQAGADWRGITPNLGIGPFVMFSLGQYSNCSYSGALASFPGNCTIQNGSLHEWLTFGVRGAYDIHFGG
jgi:hypothetical protein